LPLGDINRDLASMLKQAGQLVSVAGREINAFVRKHDGRPFDDRPAQTKGTQIVLTVRTVDVEDVDAGAAVSFEGKDYQVSDKFQISNGAATQLYCRLP